MVSWSTVRIVLRVSLAIALVYVSWVFLSRRWGNRQWSSAEDAGQARRNAEFARTYGGSDVKILQFYAREGNLTQGSPTVICYGVLNARTVRIDPPVDGVSPAVSRCVEIAPLQGTKYTLIAEGNDGHTVSESFVLQVSADQAKLPRITYFRIANHRVEGSRHFYTLAFGDQNAEEVSIDPPVFPTLHGAPNGQFLVGPEQTTTYTLRVTGKFGHKAEQKLKIEIPPSR